jgi:hypothetical protein
MVEQHKDELGIFGRIGPTTYIADRQDGKVHLEDYISNQIEGLIEDKSVLD